MAEHSRVRAADAEPPASPLGLTRQSMACTTGGTPRHSLAIEHAVRPLFAYLRAAVVPTGVYAATEDWGQGAVATDGSLVERIERAATELAAAMAARSSAPRDAFADPVPFENLLRGSSSEV